MYFQYLMYLLANGSLWTLVKEVVSRVDECMRLGSLHTVMALLFGHGIGRF